MKGGAAESEGEACATQCPGFLNNVTSLVRVRPLPRSNLEELKDPRALSVVSSEEGGKEGGRERERETILLRDGRGKDRIFKPSIALSEKATQQDVFNRCGRGIVDCLLSASPSGSPGEDGCDGVVLCYGGDGMGKRHTLYETSTSSRLKDFEEEEWEWSYANAMRGRGRGKDETGLLVRVVHEVFRRKAWMKFRREKDRDGGWFTPQSTGRESLSRTPMSASGFSQVSDSPQASHPMLSDVSDLDLQCSSFAVTQTGLVTDLLDDSSLLAEAEEESPVPDSLRTPNLRRTKAVAEEREKRKQVDHVRWATCTNTVDFEAMLKPAIALCRKHKEEGHHQRSSPANGGEGKVKDFISSSKEWIRRKNERVQFIVTQVRLVKVNQGGLQRTAARDGHRSAGAPYTSKIAFVLVLPSETMSMEGPVLTGTHLSAPMLRLRAVLDSLTGIGGKSHSLLRANASLATMLAAPLGSSRMYVSSEDAKGGSRALTTCSHSTGKTPFVCLIGCVSPSRSQVNQVAGFLSFAERAESAKLLHVTTEEKTPRAPQAPPLKFEDTPLSAVTSRNAIETGAAEETTPSFKTPALSANGLLSVASSSSKCSVGGGAMTAETTAVTPAPAPTPPPGAKTPPPSTSGSPLANQLAKASAMDSSAEGNKNRKAIVPLATPPSVRAVSKLVWPSASPATFDAGLSDFAHIRDELESIWSVMREAERYHEDALATAEVELQEAEAATRRAGARATEMRKIIASLRNEIENQKALGGSRAAPSKGEGERIKSMEVELRRLKDQVMDEQTLRREAEAAVASLDDECALLTEKNKELAKKLEDSPAQAREKKSRNVRIQCALPGSASKDAAASTNAVVPDIEVPEEEQEGKAVVVEEGEEGDSAGGAEREEDVGELAKESSEATIGDVVGSPRRRILPQRGEDEDFSSEEEEVETPNSNIFPQGQSEPSTPTLVQRKKSEPKSTDTEIMSREEAMTKASDFKDDEVESTHSLKELPKKQNPKELDAEGVVEKRRRHSSFNKKFKLEDLMDEKEEENPLVLIIAVNMYKGHTEKIHIHREDSAEEIAKDFVKVHNLPQASIKNLEKLINKNLARNNIAIGRKARLVERERVRGPEGLDEQSGTPVPPKKRDNAPEAVKPPPQESQKRATPKPSSGTPPPKSKTPTTRSSEPERAALSSPISAVSDSSPARPLRPMDMYRFIN